MDYAFLIIIAGTGDRGQGGEQGFETLQTSLAVVQTGRLFKPETIHNATNIMHYDQLSKCSLTAANRFS